MARGGAQYLLPPELAGSAARDALAARLDLGGEPAAVAERTYYDTFDGRLHAAGLVLVHGDGRLALADADSYVELAAVERPDSPERVLASELPRGRLRGQLEPVAEQRALTPVARVRSRVRRLRVLDGHAKTVARLVLDEPLRRRGRAALHARVVVAPVRGYDRALARVHRVLEDDLGLVLADAPLHDEAVRAAGGTPGGVPGRPRVRLDRRQRSDAAAAAVLKPLLAAIEANLPGAVADVDPEFLHELRVALRRSRSVARQFAGVFPPAPLARMRNELRWLQQATGGARDLDVHLLDLDDLRAALPPAAAADLAPLRDVVAERRRTEHTRARRALRSKRARSLLAEWSALLDELNQGPAELTLLPADDRPDAERPVVDLAGERIRAAHRRMVKAGRRINDSSPPEDLHELRKKGKELRYLLELFGGLYPERVVKQMVASLKALQDTLGRFQDREVQAELLRASADDVAAREGGAAALMAMGSAVDRLDAEQHAAREQFAQRFAAFAANPRRAVVERTFR
jgi:CHAD domain-containing protein